MLSDRASRTKPAQRPDDLGPSAAALIQKRCTRLHRIRLQNMVRGAEPRLCQRQIARQFLQYWSTDLVPFPTLGLAMRKMTTPNLSDAPDPSNRKHRHYDRARQRNSVRSSWVGWGE